MPHITEEGTYYQDIDQVIRRVKDTPHLVIMLIMPDGGYFRITKEDYIRYLMDRSKKITFFQNLSQDEPFGSVLISKDEKFLFHKYDTY